MKKIKYIDLFAGCGGLSLGFDLSGDFESVAFVENWKPAIDTFKENFPNSILLGEDITKVIKEDVKKLLKESYAYTNSDMINDLPNEQQRVDLFLNELAEKDKLTIKRPFNEWTPTPPTYKFTQPEYVKLKKNWCKNFNFKINVLFITNDFRKINKEM